VSARFCSVCGHPLAGGVPTCSSCGSRVLITAVPADQALASVDPKAGVVPEAQMRRRMTLFYILAPIIAAFVVYVTVVTVNLEDPLIGALIIVLMYGLVRLPKPKSTPNMQLRQPR